MHPHPQEIMIRRLSELSEEEIDALCEEVAGTGGYPVGDQFRFKGDTLNHRKTLGKP